VLLRSCMVNQRHRYQCLMWANLDQFYQHRQLLRHHHHHHRHN
jgi:hypothetical protein